VLLLCELLSVALMYSSYIKSYYQHNQNEMLSLHIYLMHIMTLRMIIDRK